MWQQMVSWWFGFCDDSDKYRLWHPRDHVEGRWSEGYYRVGGLVADIQFYKH
jgi:hypothetical protein